LKALSRLDGDENTATRAQGGPDQGIGLRRRSQFSCGTPVPTVGWLVAETGDITYRLRKTQRSCLERLLGLDPAAA
jgi:hypothetical protein